MKIKILSTSLAASLLSSHVMAHQGDHSGGSVMSSIWHQVTEPDHLLLAGLIAAAIFGGVRTYMKKKS
ncbi:hypothetical protein [Endozoicomonas ascidiicola]|uniref:hypothetical protein n=1 Tax=Endozoicomonas ascidiicola TaxID=1698521 RepID=UPI000836A261|nr:hypothetical protein [Endozoicomonas ascidiicola]